MTRTISSNRNIGALTIVLVGALLWGVYWVPIRFLEAQGLPGIWAGFVLAGAAFVCAVTLYLIRRETRPEPVQIFAAFLVGVAFALYGAAIAYTDVVRAILLFYLTPIWSMLIECAFFGRRWTLKSTLAIVAALVGIVFIFRGELPVEGLGAVGDWMSFLAGIAWSIASALVFSRGRIGVISLSTWALGASAVVSGIVVLAVGASPQEIHANPLLDVVHVSGLAFAIGALYVVPVMLLTLWGTTQFSAVTMGFLLTGEIVSGVATSAIFLGEPFGVPEIAGTILIVTGASIEILWPDVKRPDV